jgi:hypothetical protein
MMATRDSSLPLGFLFCLGLACSGALAGCVAPLEAPSAFDDQQYLCDPGHADAWRARIESCRDAFAADGSCLGVISLRGILDNENVVMDSPVTRLVITDTPNRDGVVVRDYFVSGRAPYFDFSLDLTGFAVPPAHSANGIIIATATCNPDPGTDLVCFNGVLNIEVRGGTELLRLQTLVRNIRVETVSELEFNFSSDLARGGNLSGCLDFNLAGSP